MADKSEGILESEVVAPELDTRSTGDSRPRLSSVVSRLTAVTAAQAALSLVTGPLQARILGPVGRGEVASISSTLIVLPAVVGLGLNSYALWAAARGRPLGKMLTTTLSLSLLASLPVVALAPILSHAIGGSHSTVCLYLEIGMFMAPIALIGPIFYDAAIGLEQWRSVLTSRWINVLVAAIATLALAIAGALTVATAAIILLVSCFSLIPVVISVCRSRLGALHWSEAIAREALGYGARSWAWGILQTTNGRLDQVLMLPLAGARQLGLYAVGATASTVFVSVIVGPVISAVQARVAGGSSDSVQAASRVVSLAAFLQGVVGAIVGPVMIYVLFGGSYVPAIPMMLILLVATVFLSVNLVLTAACSGAGHPEVGAYAEGAAVVVTVVGLVLLTPPLGGIGAAIVSVIAYAITVSFVLKRSIRLFGGTLADYIMPRRSDIVQLEEALRIRQRLAKISGSLRNRKSS